jgi:hypothetical protein
MLCLVIKRKRKALKKGGEFIIKGGGRGGLISQKSTGLFSLVRGAGGGEVSGGGTHYM